MPTMSTPELTKLSHTLARALSADQVNQLGRDTGQAERLRTVTPHRPAPKVARQKASAGGRLGDVWFSGNGLQTRSQ